MIQTTITFVHADDNYVMTITSDERLGEMTGIHTARPGGSAWDRVWGLIREPLTDEGAAVFGLPCGVYDQIFAHLEPLEPTPDWEAYLYRVCASPVTAPLGVVSLNERYEVIQYWPLPMTSAAITEITN